MEYTTIKTVFYGSSQDNTVIVIPMVNAVLPVQELPVEGDIFIVTVVLNQAQLPFRFVGRKEAHEWRRELIQAIADYYGQQLRP